MARAKSSSSSIGQHERASDAVLLELRSDLAEQRTQPKIKRLQTA